MKKFAVAGLLLMVVGVMAGCQEREFIYQDEVVTETQLESILDSTLELENPDYDIEVNVYVESD